MGTKLNGLTEDKGISPVIGVILMVAITVTLAAVLGLFLTDLGDNLSSSSATDSSILTEETDNGYQLRVQQIGEGVQEIQVRAGGSTITTLDQVGETTEVEAPSDTNITVVQVSSDGTEQVTKTLTVDDSNASDVGTVADSTPTATSTPVSLPRFVDTSSNASDTYDAERSDSGNWYILGGSGTVTVYNSDLTNTTGATYDLTSELNDPRGLYQDSSGDWYVVGVDSNVYQYDSDFNLKNSYSLDPDNTRGMDITKAPNGDWLITDDAQAGVYRYDSSWNTQTFVRTIQDTGDTNPVGIDTEGETVWIVGGSTNTAYEYDSSLQTTGDSFEFTEGSATNGLHIYDGSWIVTDWDDNGVYIYRERL